MIILFILQFLIVPSVQMLLVIYLIIHLLFIFKVSKYFLHNLSFTITFAVTHLITSLILDLFTAATMYNLITTYLNSLYLLVYRYLRKVFFVKILIQFISFLIIFYCNSPSKPQFANLVINCWSFKFGSMIFPIQLMLIN